jgi:hypothetical protein
MANEALTNVITQLANPQMVPNIDIGKSAVATQNILRAQQMQQDMSPENILAKKQRQAVEDKIRSNLLQQQQLQTQQMQQEMTPQAQYLRKQRQAMMDALATKDSKLARKMYESYDLGGETPDFNFAEDETQVAIGGRIYKGPKALMNQFAGAMDQIDTPEELGQASNWFIGQGGSILTDPYYKESGIPSIKTKEIEVDGRIKLTNMNTGEVIKDLGEAPKKSPLVSIGGEDEYQKERAKRTAQWVDETYKQSGEAYNTLINLDELEDIINDPDVYQGGTGAKVYSSINKIFGTKTGGKYNLLETFSMKMRGATRLETIGPGPVSEAEQKLWNKIAPNVENTREGNLKIVEVNRLLAQRKIAYSKKLRELERQGVPPLELQTRMGEWVDSQENVFSKVFGDVQQAGSQQAGQIPTITNQAEFDNLPSGAVFIEDGKQYRKP